MKTHGIILSFLLFFLIVVNGVNGQTSNKIDNGDFDTFNTSAMTTLGYASLFDSFGQYHQTEDNTCLTDNDNVNGTCRILNSTQCTNSTINSNGGCASFVYGLQNPPTARSFGQLNVTWTDVTNQGNLTVWFNSLSFNGTTNGDVQVQIRDGLGYSTTCIATDANPVTGVFSHGTLRNVSCVLSGLTLDRNYTVEFEVQATGIYYLHNISLYGSGRYV